MKIALISLNQVWQDKEANKIRSAQFIEKASAAESTLVIFPEMTLTGFSMNTTEIAEDSKSSLSLFWFCEQAKVNKIAIIMGYVEWNSNHRKARNCMVMINAQGEVIGLYAKVHPFSFVGEDLLFEKGNSLAFCRYEETLFGLTICYDLRFPELYQALSKTCHIIITIASWPVTRGEHWQVLLQARAIENQVFMIGVNRSGSDPNGLEYGLTSHVFTPSGSCLHPLEMEEEFALYNLDLTEVEKMRTAFPVKEDRRVDFYKSIL